MKLTGFGLLVLLINFSSAYKILVIPYSSGFNSRLLNTQKIADILAEDGHHVDVLMNSRVQQHIITKHAKVVNFYAPETVPVVNSVDRGKPTMWNILHFVNQILEIEFKFTECLVKDKKMWALLEAQNYDLIFGDVLSFGVPIVATKLNVTPIYYMNFMMSTSSYLIYPVFPSFTCMAPGMTCTDESMSFLEKIGNMAMKLLMHYHLLPKTSTRIEELLYNNGIKLNVSFQDSFKNKIVVINAHYALDTPIPTMPSVFPISGLFHKKPSPLPKEFSDIVKASEPHGIILMSFGTLQSDFDAEKAEMFARVFGRLPHHVIWKLDFEAPKSLKPNIHPTQWFPQNDLLANSMVKLFITHCGISSTFESSLHGIPVIAMPLLADQHGNAAKLTKKLKMGITLDFYTITEEQLEKGVHEVLSNPVYTENAKRASYLLNDHIVSPQQQLRHLVNFTIKSGGAPHLFHPYAVDMNWFQFFGLDVLCVILSVVLTVLVLLFMLLRACVRRLKTLVFGRKSKQS